MHGNFGPAFTLRWISIETGKFHGNPEKITTNEKITLATPDTGSSAGWAATFVVDEEQKKLAIK
jgi:hypothetical protein